MKKVLLTVFTGLALLMLPPTTVFAQGSAAPSVVEQVCDNGPDAHRSAYDKVIQENGFTVTEYTGRLLEAIGKVWPLDPSTNRMYAVNLPNSTTAVIEFFNDCAVYQEIGSTNQWNSLVQTAKEKHQAGE